MLALFLISSQAAAFTPIPNPEPQPGSYGLEAIKTQPPPSEGATIAVPGEGASFTDSPITVSGTCPSDLLVQVYNNGVMVGAVMCTNGSFSLEISLFVGENELSAIVYDGLEQAGPVSNTRTVNYSNTNFVAFGELITLTSSFGRRSAPAGNQLTWPLQISGGTGPYAFSIDWGDGSVADLMSQSLAGLVNVTHTYRQAGIYTVNIKVTDVNGVSAFLQLIAVSSGQVESASVEKTPGDTSIIIRILWVPAVVSMILLWPAFWLGRRSQLVSLRNKMEKERDEYAESQSS